MRKMKKMRKARKARKTRKMIIKNFYLIDLPVINIVLVPTKQKTKKNTEILIVTIKTIIRMKIQTVKKDF